MARILILFAHPALEKSRVHARLIRAIPDRPGITLHDLYEAYPDYDVDVPREQSLLLQHDLVVVQHPFFWYSTPPLVKQWEDLVLEHGWAYGREGKMLRGKWIMNLLTAGGREAAYRHEGHNRFTIRELLAPVEQTMHLCGMRYLPPYVIHATHRLDAPDIEREAERYRRFLTLLHDDALDLESIRPLPTFNAALDLDAAEVAP